MLIRIVKMTLLADKSEAFRLQFQQIKDKIKAFEGCELLELYQDKSDPTVFFTYSYWQSEADLNNYRTSVFFKEVWSQTKKMFSEKAEAWSVNKIVSLGNS